MVHMVAPSPAVVQPSAQVVQAVEPFALVKVPIGHGEQVSLPMFDLKVPGAQLVVGPGVLVDGPGVLVIGPRPPVVVFTSTACGSGHCTHQPIP